MGGGRGGIRPSLASGSAGGCGRLTLAAGQVQRGLGEGGPGVAAQQQRPRSVAQPARQGCVMNRNQSFPRRLLVRVIKLSLKLGLRGATHNDW